MHGLYTTNMFQMENRQVLMPVEGVTDTERTTSWSGFAYAGGVWIAEGEIGVQL